MPKQMQQSLGDRFRGALLGAALGEILGANYQIQQAAGLPISWLEVERWGLQPPQQENGWGRGVVQQTQSLIQHQAPLRFNTLLSLRPSLPQPSSVSAGLAIHLIPLMLFHHEDWQQLRHVLYEASLESGFVHPQNRLVEEPSDPSGCLPLSLLSIGYAMSLALQNQLNAEGFLPQFLTQFEQHASDPTRLQELEHIQTCLATEVGLSTAKTRLKSVLVSPETIALYSFLSTPQNFQIALLRAAQLGHHPQITCALTGALCGAHQGILGMPLNWRRVLRFTSGNTALSNLWQLSSEASLFQLADGLHAAWSGIHNLSSWQQQAASYYTAAPNVIRPR